MSDQVEMRLYQPGDEVQILALFRQSYGRALSEPSWAWRFRKGPAGPGVIYLCWDGDLLAAHYAVTPLGVRIQGKDWIAALSGTTMTHPNYRGQRLFPKLAQATYDHLARSGMAMVWGFPNLFSHRGLIRDLGWRDIYEVPALRLPLNPGLSLPTSSRILELERFDSRFDGLWERVRDDYGVIAKRDRKHLQWRYEWNPGGGYRILAWVEGGVLLGYALLKRFYTELQVVDILTVQDPKVGIALIAQAAQIALENSALGLSLWLNVTHPLHHALEKLGFRNGEPVTYFGGLALQAGLSGAGLYEFRNWYLTMGDSDVF